MQKYQDVVLNQNGNPVSGVQVTVTDLLGTPVSVYSSNAIGLNVNPLTSDNNGRFSFYAPDGRYSLSFSFGGNVVASITDILLEDPIDGSDAVFNDVTILGELSDASKVTSAPVGGLTATNVQAALAELDSEKIDASSLAAPGGSALVGYDGGTAQAVLDEAKPMANYTALRAYSGRATGLRITQSGLAGFFRRDDADTTSSDNGGTIIVDASGRRWKRLVSGHVNVKWFGAKGDGVTDDTAAIMTAIAALQDGWTLEFPAGTYTISVATEEPDWFNDPSWTNRLYFGLQVKDKANITINGNGAVIKVRNGQIIQDANVRVPLHLYRVNGLRIIGLTIDGNAANNAQNFTDGSAMVLTSGENYNIGLQNFRIKNSSLMGCYFGYNLGGHNYDLQIDDLYISGATYGLVYDNVVRSTTNNVAMLNVGVGMQFIGVGTSYHDAVINNFTYTTTYSEGALLFDKVKGIRANNVTIDAAVADYYGAITTYQAVSQPTSDQEDIVISNVNARITGAHARVVYTDRNSKMEIIGGHLELTGSDQQVCFCVNSSELTLRDTVLKGNVSAHVQVADSATFQGYDLWHKGSPTLVYNVNTAGRLLIESARSDNSIGSSVTAGDFTHANTKNLKMSASGVFTISANGSWNQWTSPHGLIASPRKVIGSPATTAAAAANPFLYADATNLFFTFTTAPAAGTDNVEVNFIAEV